MWILLLMIAIMPFEQNPHLRLGDNFLGVFPNFTMIKLLGLIGLFWSGVQFLNGRPPGRALDSPQTRAFVVFLAAIVFGGLASGAGGLQVTRLLSIIGFLPLLVAAVRSERRLWQVAQAIAGVMVAVFPYALRQVFRYGGRLGVGLYETNYFGLILVLVFPLSIALARTRRGKAKAFWWCGACVIGLELILTGSRGAFLAFLLTLALLALRLLRHPMVFMAGGAVVLLLSLSVFPNSLTRRLLASGLSDSMQDTGVEASNHQRFLLLQGGLRMVAANPLTGIGLGNFKAELPKYVDVPLSNIAHDTYLELAAELGLPALAAFVFVVFTALRSLERSAALARHQCDRTHREISIALQAGLAGYLVGALFLSAQYEKFFWLVLFLSISVERVARRKARATRLAQAAAA